MKFDLKLTVNIDLAKLVVAVTTCVTVLNKLGYL